MAKQEFKRPSLKAKEQKPLIADKYKDYIYIGILLVSVFVFFGSAIFGHGFDSPDNLSSMSFHTFLGEAKKDGTFPLWMPYIFSGMPSYGSLLTTGDRYWDFIPMFFFGITKLFGGLFNSDVARLASVYAIYGIGLYLLMNFKKHDKFVSFFVAFAAMFSTSVIVWPMIGHNTKPIVLAIFPYVFLFMEKLRIKFSIVFTILLTFAIHLMLEAGHIQMFFYGLCAFGLYLLFELVSRLITKKEPLKVLRVAGLLAVAGGVAFLLSSDRYLTTLEYTPYSVRGSAPIEKTKNQHQDQKGGNDYQYATMWSFSPGEMATFFVPNFYGFGQLKYKGELTGGKEAKLPTYWGQKPMEDAAPYMGILIFGLAVIGAFFYRKDAFMQFLIALSVFSVLLAFGYTFPVVYDFFYYNVPNFNKFRAPSMALALIQFAFPIMAGYGLTALLRKNPEESNIRNKTVLVSLIASAAFLVFGFIYSAAFQNSYFASVEGSKIYQQFSSMYGPSIADTLKEFVWDSMISDWYLTAFIALIGAALIYMYSKDKLGKPILFISLAVLLIFDMWRVAYRPMEVAESSLKFPSLDYMEFMKQDKGKFRIADFTEITSRNVNMPAYYMLESVNGYHAAKLRVYQDMLDVADQGSTSQVTNPFLWSLLNVKYIISPQPMGSMPPVFQSQQVNALVYTNPQYLPRVFFVNSAEKSSQKDILNRLKAGDFNPRELAFVEKDLPSKIDAPTEAASAKVTNYENEYIKIQANASGNNLLFLSEIFYPVSWKAFIDGKETEIYKTNFAFRSIIVPKGNHTVELKFESKAFEQGKTYSSILNYVTIALLAVGLFLERKNLFAKKDENNEVKE